MSDPASSVKSFAGRLRKVLVELDSWVGRHHDGVPQAREISRAELRLKVGELDRLVEALSWGPSVGLYGESQCGKSNLVSRFAESLGAQKTPEGNLCVLDPGTPAGAAAPPWQGEVPGGIEFVKWIDPGGAGESTGIVCRFTTAPIEAPAGHFRVSFISHAELLCALADGHEKAMQGTGAAATEEEILKRRARDRETLKRLRASSQAMEEDADRTMVDLLQAVKMLEDAGMRSRVASLQHGNGQEGDSWQEFVLQCVAVNRRPPLGRAGQSDLQALVSMLWEGDEALGELWFDLYRDLRKLRKLERPSLLSTDVCRPGPGKKPLVDVEWLNELSRDARSEECLVHGLHGASRRPAQESVRKGAIVALARELVLPVRAGAGPAFDVIDFPGARAFDPKSVEAQGDDGARFKVAIDALKRGKLNRLFVAGVEHFDSSVLCLTADSGGNLEASAIVRRALSAWLRREGWRRRDTQDLEPQPRAAEVPLVLAMTKVDRLLKEPGRVEAKLRAVQDGYAPADLPWMERWDGEEPFHGAYWVYNPRANLGAGRIVRMSDPSHREAAAAFREAFQRSGLLLKHTADAGRNLDALFDAGQEGADVRLLAEAIRDLAVRSGERRVPELGALMLRIAGSVLGRMQAIHLGEGNPGAVDDALATGRRHAQVISRLRVPEAARLLGALSIRPEQAMRAWSRLRKLGAAVPGGVRGSVSFEAYYNELNAVFREDFNASMERQHTLWKAAVERQGPSTLPTELAARLCLLPSAKWFRESVRMRLQPLLEKVNTAQLQPQQLAAVVGAQWNRCMTWLASEPPDTGVDIVGVPTLRGEEASNRAVVVHWGVALPQAYRDLVDGEMRTQAWNLELGDCLERLRSAVEELRAAVPSGAAAAWSGLQDDLSGLSSGPAVEGASR